MSKLTNAISECFEPYGLLSEYIPQVGDVLAHHGASLVRYYSPAPVRRRGRIQILGVVGISIPEFELGWMNLVRQFPPSEPIGDVTTLTSYITNFPTLINPPDFASLEEAALNGKDWFHNISLVVNLLPDDLGTLIQDLRHSRVGPFPSTMMIGHPVKFLALSRWAVEHVGVGFSPNTICNPHPYEDLAQALRSH